MRNLVFVIGATVVLIGCGQSSEPKQQGQKQTVTARETQTLTKAEPVVSILRIVGKNKAAVTELLGQPTGCENTKQGKRCSYREGKVEIVFINGKADWITVSDLQDARYHKESLALLGLPVEDPVFSNEYTIRWQDLAGLREVNFFPSGSKIFYVYIRAFTE